MTRPNSRRPMSRAAYQARLAALKAEHPWLAKQVVEPAPGHLAVLAHFVGQCELLMKPADYRHLPLFCATTQRDKRCVTTVRFLQKRSENRVQHRQAFILLTIG